MNVDAKNFTSISEFIERNSHFFFIKPQERYKSGPGDSILTENTAIITDHFRKILPEQWGEASLGEAFDNIAGMLCVKPGWNSDQTLDLAKASRVSMQYYLRWALTGGRPGPTLMATMSILGRDVSLKRIEDAAAMLKRTKLEGNKRLAQK